MANEQVRANGAAGRGCPTIHLDFDVCVVGGGMAGMCASIAAARNGANTVIVQDRPVFGGNASSEIRMWICGALGKNNKETGLIEEIQLENQYRNPALNYSVWDSVLYGKVAFQPNLTPLLNCTCMRAAMDGDRIGMIEAWQLTTQTTYSISAKYFIDCSGDSILAALSPAEFRAGREARSEFGEDIEPETADSKTMGNSLLIQFRRTDEAQLFVPPMWAYRFDSMEDLPNRYGRFTNDNFWWIEVGGLGDTVHDSEENRDELMKIVYGVADFIKNRGPERDLAANWAVDWIGALPGKRENRRFIGDHIFTQNDVRSGGQFDDIIAYGGWSMDDHHPAGIYYPGHPTIFHAAPSPYGIPYRSLYSRNVANLLFAGRNISVTHAALTTTREMATGAIMGQAVGTAAAICVRDRVEPRSLSRGERLRELQRTLMDDDCWLPGLTRQMGDLVMSAQLSGEGDGLERLMDGVERDRENETHAWIGQPGSAIEFEWSRSIPIAGLRIVFDSNLNHAKKMPCLYPQRGGQARVPGTLVRKYRVDARSQAGGWSTIFREENNYQRLATPLLNVHTRALRFVPEETWGAEDVRVFALEPLGILQPKIPPATIGSRFAQVRGRIDPRSLAAPDNGMEPAAAAPRRAS